MQKNSQNNIEYMEIHNSMFHTLIIKYKITI